MEKSTQRPDTNQKSGPPSRPDVPRWLFVEDAAIAVQGARIPIVELGALQAATAGWLTDAGLGRGDLAAQALPIAARVNEVQVPCLIHVFGRTHRIPAFHREDEEALVFADDPRGVGMSQSLLAGETTRVGQLRAGFISSKASMRSRSVAVAESIKSRVF